jgi:peptide/nickel transport system permease protein
MKSPTDVETVVRSGRPVKMKKKHSNFKEIWKRFRKNPLAVIGLVILILMFILAISADWLAPGDPDLGLPGYNLQNWGNSRQFPSREHIFGTDQMGRDMFARIAHGSRISLSVGFVVVGIGLFIGIPIGCVAGFYGGIRDNIIMRFLDILLAMPNILLAIAISATLGPGVRNVMIAVGVGAIPTYARTVRALVLTVKEQEFIEAARSCGASDKRLIFRHILPNCIAPVIVEATMGLAGAILSAAGLSFIGVGLAPPTPEWGAMLSDGRQWMLSGFWHMTLFPGLMIAMLIFSLNMMGDGLRDAFDPKLRSGGFSKKRFKRILKQKALTAEAAKINEGGVV